MKTPISIFKLLALSLIVFLTTDCAVNPVTGKKEFMLVSESQEIAMGAQYDPEITATFGEYNDETLQKFVEQKGLEMAKISHRPNLQYHFKVLDSPVVNAFAVPGGYIYLTRGILAQLNNEAELAGIMGHEMGHVSARHTAQQLSQQQVAQLGLALGAAVSKEFAQLAGVASQGVELLFLKFSRDNEREADRLGVEYSSKIGYDAHQMADFFKVLQKMQMGSESAGIPTFMSTHPDPGDRYNSVNKMAAQWQDSLKISSWMVNQDSYLRLVNGLVYGDDPRQGYVEGNTFYHPGMKFQYPIPSGWTLVNSPIQVQVAPSDGKALILFSLAEQKTSEQAATETLQKMNLTLLENKKINVNGLAATEALSQQVTQDQQTGKQSGVKVVSYFIEYNGSVYSFHGVSKLDDFPAYEKLFETTMSGFKTLTDPQKINVKPKLLKIKTVQKTATLADVFKYYKVPETKMAELALLNDLELTQTVEKGKLIKIVE